MASRILLILAVTIPLAAVDGVAQGATIMGRGLTSCGAWTAEHQRNTQTSIMQEDWAVGFLSGLAAAANDTSLASTDYSGVVAWITNYCAQNPLDPIATAVHGLFLELAARP
jgi:hypothetical protein